MEMNEGSDEMDHSEHQNMQPISAETDTTQESGHQHSEHLDILVENYLGMKNALTEDDLDEAKNYFREFAEEVRTSSEMNNHEEHSDRHATHHQAMVSAVNEAENTTDIEAFRTAFKKISAELITAIENQGYESTLFRQYCPMYQGGSEWISDSETIENPFYGSQMHSCGETVEELN